MPDDSDRYPLASSIDPIPPFHGPRLPWTIRYPSRRSAYQLSARERLAFAWICRKCGAQNDPDRAGCESCGSSCHGYLPSSLPLRPW